jgi:hypothetical protein
VHRAAAHAMSNSSRSHRGRPSDPGKQLAGGPDGAARATPGKRTLTETIILRSALPASPRPQPAPPGELFERAAGGPASEIPHRAAMERAFGHSFGGVAAHLGGAETGDALDGLGARAAALGERVAFRDPSPSPELVAHELTHVVQARAGGGAGPHASATLGRPSDPAEREAEQVAARVAAGQPAGPIRATAGGIARDQEQVVSSISTQVIGHASPRWRHPDRGKTAADENLALSVARAEAAQKLIAYILTQMSRGMAGTPDFQFTAIGVDPADEVHVDPVRGSAAGSSATLKEAGGDSDANDEHYRRADIVITVSWEVYGEVGESNPELPREEKTTGLAATTEWGLRLDLSEGVGSVVGVAGLTGKIKNLSTGEPGSGQEASFVILGATIGLGVSAPTPQASGGSFTPFKTAAPVTLRQFDYSAVGWGGGTVSAGVGGGLGAIKFFNVESEWIDISGMSVGGFTVDLTGGVGVLLLSGAPGEIATSVGVNADSSTPYKRERDQSYTETIVFDSGSAVIRPDQELALWQLAERIFGVAAPGSGR